MLGSRCEFLLIYMKSPGTFVTNARIHSNFKIFNVSTAFTPAMVIENVLAGKAAPKGWAITEVVEKGDGAWAKVRALSGRKKILTSFGTKLTFLLTNRAPQSSTVAIAPALHYQAWAGRATVATACRLSGWFCIRCEESV
jgi:hypothetical protein